MLFTSTSIDDDDDIVAAMQAKLHKLTALEDDVIVGVLAPVIIAVIGVLLAALCFLTYQFCHKYPANQFKRVLSHLSNAEEHSHHENEDAEDDEVSEVNGSSSRIESASFVGYMCKEKMIDAPDMASSRSKSEDFREVKRGLGKV